MPRKLLLLGIVVVAFGVCASVSLALDPMGPPAAGLKKAQFSIGIDYAWSDNKVERRRASWSDSREWVKLESMHKVYANLGYGLADNVEAFVRVGSGVTDYNLRGYDEWDGDSDWDKIFYGGGVKATLVEEPGVKWGALAQYSWGSFNGDVKDQDNDEGTFHLELDEMQIAVGPSWTVGEKVVVYCGPFLHFVRGTVEDRHDGDELRHPIETENSIGGYAGIQVELSPNCCSLNGEFMYTDDCKGIGVSMVWRQ